MRHFHLIHLFAALPHRNHEGLELAVYVGESFICGVCHTCCGNTSGIIVELSVVSSITFIVPVVIRIVDNSRGVSFPLVVVVFSPRGESFITRLACLLITVVVVATVRREAPALLGTVVRLPLLRALRE